MVSEIFAAGEGAVGVSVVPGANGVFTVTVDGEMVFDKSVTGDTPNLNQAKEIKAAVRNRLESKVAAAV
jgi:predicted Rdx family selenoprotein